MEVRNFWVGLRFGFLVVVSYGFKIQKFKSSNALISKVQRVWSSGSQHHRPNHEFKGQQPLK